MPSKGQETKDKLMDIAETMFLKKGFSGMSIADLILEAKITKSGFFYHFESKNALAYALMERYLVNDRLIFSGLFQRADELTDDPLQQMLIFVKLLAEMMADLEALHPGCLIASFTYENNQVNEAVKQITKESVLEWRRIFRHKIDQINQQYDPNIEASSDDLADMLSSLIEGGIVVSRALNDPQILVKQLLEYRSYISLLYQSR